jgi:hypothetical protein
VEIDPVEGADGRLPHQVIFLEAGQLEHGSINTAVARLGPP